MTNSVEWLQRKVQTPINDCFGPRAKVLTVEDYGDEVRGLASCPGRIFRYVFEIESKQLRTFERLSIKKIIYKE